MVLSTCLFDKPAFKNLICNGLVLAEDGRKMSKRLKNYPDPVYILNAYGADSLRLYLINSPVVHAEDLKFKEDGVKQGERLSDSASQPPKHAVTTHHASAPYGNPRALPMGSRRSFA